MTAKQDNFDVFLAWACAAVYERGEKAGKQQAALLNTPEFKGAFQCAADVGLTEDTRLRSVFTSAFMDALEAARKTR